MSPLSNLQLHIPTSSKLKYASVCSDCIRTLCRQDVKLKSHDVPWMLDRLWCISIIRLLDIKVLEHGSITILKHRYSPVLFEWYLHSGMWDPKYTFLKLLMWPNLNSNFSMQTTCPFELPHFDPNPISTGQHARLWNILWSSYTM